MLPVFDPYDLSSPLLSDILLTERSYTNSRTEHIDKRGRSDTMLLATLKGFLSFGLLNGQRREAARNEDLEAAWSLAQAEVPPSCAPVAAHSPVKAATTVSSSPGMQSAEHDQALPPCSCGLSGQPRSMVSRGTSPDNDNTSVTSPECPTADNTSGTIAVAGDDEPADDDARRKVNYSYFEGEDESDYTAGPIRIVEASDGVKSDCGALLLNLDLSQKIRNAVEAETDLANANLKAKAQTQECLEFEHELKSKIDKHEYGLALAQQEAEQDEQNMDEIQALHAELEKLNSLLEETVAEREDIQNGINNKVEEYLQLQVEVNRYLEEAFIVANLLPPAEELKQQVPIARDVETEYKKLCQKDDLRPDDDNDYNLHSFDDDFQPQPLSDEEQKEKELQDAYDEAKMNLRDAQAQFDKREHYREQDRRENDWALGQSRGAEGLPWEEFDVLWVQKISEFTRELIDAEAAFAAARKAATEAGVAIDDADQSSEFGDEDGVYPPSLAEQLIAFVPRHRVTAWLAAISSPEAGFEDARSDMEVDEWDAEEVDVGDSYSTVAEPESKRKIRKWQQACGNRRRD